MRAFFFAVMVGFVLLASFAQSEVRAARTYSYCRTLSDFEQSLIVGSFTDVLECKKVSYCWDFTPTNCASITLDPGENEGAVAQECSQSVQDEQVISGKNESCQLSKKDVNICEQSSASVTCRRVYACEWNAVTKICYPSSNFGFSVAPADCENK
jgi:hypothetical protein